MRGSKILLLFLFLMVFMASLVSSRKMWGIRKKKGEEDDTDSMAEGLLNGMAKKAGKEPKTPPKKKQNVPLFDALTDINLENLPKEPSVEEILTLSRTFLDKMQDMLDTNQFEQYFNEDTIRDILSKLGEMNENLKLDELINLDDIKDMTEVKEKLSEGIKIVREFFNEFEDAMMHPEKVEELMNRFPPEFRTAIDGVLKGDTSAAKKFIESLPGIEQAQKEMVYSLLDGNYEDILKMSSQAGAGGLLTDDALETVRKQLQENPSLAVSTGIPLEALNDPVLFKDFMQNSMNSLFGGKDMGDLEGLAQQFQDQFASLGGNLEEQFGDLGAQFQQFQDQLNQLNEHQQHQPSQTKGNKKSTGGKTASSASSSKKSTTSKDSKKREVRRVKRNA